MQSDYKRKNSLEKHDVIWEEDHCLSNGEHLPLLIFPALTQTGIVKHCFTTRAGGVSKGIFSSLNLSFTRGDDTDAVSENYRRVAEALDVDLTRIVCSDQTHTTNVRVITEEDAGKGVVRPKDYTDVDGMITNVPGLTLATFFADCVPLYFVDPVHRAIGLSHSGWRGTMARMGEKTLLAMAENYGTRPEDVVCAVGPSICQDCYEVSADVAEVFAREFSGHEAEILRQCGSCEKEMCRAKEADFVSAGTDNNKSDRLSKNHTFPLTAETIHKAGEDGKYLLDLWKTNEIVFLEAGVRPEHLSVTDICTCCNPDLLFSHRASYGQRGNLGAFLCLK
ncbi:MAG: peptidoglycan editing factor PgeF [Clostridiales bacterium]|nr:peptidoglycan editing factor PgeF [Clostridiales bacterium]